jgi:hypothetical protein
MNGVDFWAKGKGAQPQGNWVVQGLVERGVPEAAAYGIAGNLYAESGFDTGINEIAPLVPGSRGGFGLAQWTGPRRKQYEAYAAQRGVDPSDRDAQLDFLLWEGQNTEKSAWDATLQAGSPEEAARVFSERFLRPGIPHLESRIGYARQLASGQPLRGGSNTGKPGKSSYAPGQSAGVTGGNVQPGAVSGSYAYGPEPMKNALAQYAPYDPRHEAMEDMREGSRPNALQMPLIDPNSMRVW